MAGLVAGGATEALEDPLVLGKSFLATTREVGAATARAAGGDFHERLAGGLVHVPNERPGAAVGHVHLLRRRRDAAVALDVAKELDAAGAEDFLAVAVDPDPKPELPVRFVAE